MSSVKCGPFCLCLDVFQNRNRFLSIVYRGIDDERGVTSTTNQTNMHIELPYYPIWPQITYAFDPGIFYVVTLLRIYWRLPDLCKHTRTYTSISTYYSIHVPGWLLKWLNLITAPGSVSNEPGSVTWLASKYLKTVSWRNHTEKLTPLWPQNISFWPEINIPSSYFTILMLNCLENTLKLQFDSYVTAVKFLTQLFFKSTWLDLIPTLLESESV